MPDKDSALQLSSIRAATGGCPYIFKNNLCIQLYRHVKSDYRIIFFRIFNYNDKDTESDKNIHERRG